MPHLEQKALLDKFKSIRAIEYLLKKALVLYCFILDEDISVCRKAIAISALLYLVLPIDTIPDFVPFTGLSDDLALILATLSSLHNQIKPEHHAQADNLFNHI